MTGVIAGVMLAAWITSLITRQPMGSLADPAAFGPDRLRDFRNTYMSACDGRATERLVQRILNRL